MKKIIIGILCVVIGGVFLEQSSLAQESKKPARSFKQLTQDFREAKDKKGKRDALQRLSKSEPTSEEEIDQSIELIKSSDKEVSYSAGLSLGNVSDKKLVPKLILELKNKDFNVRMCTIQGVAKIKDKRAVPALIKSLDDDNTNIPYYASLALGNIGDERAIPELIARIDKKDGVAIGLSMFGVSALRPIMKELDRVFFRVSDQKMNRLIQTIGLIKDPNAIEDLKKLLKHKSPSIRQEAIQALGNMGNYSFFDDALKDNDAHVRLAAIEASRKIKDERVILMLINIVKEDSQEECKWLAMDVLSEKESPLILPLLEKMSDNDSDVLKRAAKKALRMYKSNKKK
ncbi:MAG: hypothetical protein A2328_09975 [Bdellovibrionales bacterium RIFOXYB2_FULL_36_6]|nr:MAG: hypothetical protein A2328_09975 [Bdellovibrionales bacterium RIFOXYB2_FULL_36_6]